MISPTGHGVRGNDDWGSGLYGVSRDKGIRIHEGCDFICIPGQDIVAPISGVITRLKYPYAEPVKGVFFGGLLISCANCVYTLFYFDPIKELVTMPIEQGELIGHAQDISLKYKDMIPHIHMHFDSINPEILVNLP